MGRPTHSLAGPTSSCSRNERNLGFASAVNQAYKRSSGELVLLLNSDVGLNGQALQSMIGFLDDHPTIAGDRATVRQSGWFASAVSLSLSHVLRDTRQLQCDRSALHSRYHSPIAGIPDARRRFLVRSTCASAVGELPAASPIGPSRRPRSRRAISDLLQRRPVCAVIGGARTRPLGNARCHGRP